MAVYRNSKGKIVSVKEIKIITPEPEEEPEVVIEEDPEVEIEPEEPQKNIEEAIIEEALRRLGL